MTIQTKKQRPMRKTLKLTKNYNWVEEQKLKIQLQIN